MGTPRTASVSVPLVLSPAAPWSKSLIALCVSSSLHGVLVLALVVGVVPKAQAEADTTDAWAGDTFEISMASPAPPAANAAAANAPQVNAAPEPEPDSAAAQPAALATEAEVEAEAAARAKPEAQRKSARQMRRERRRAQARRERAEAARAKPAAAKPSSSAESATPRGDGADRGERAEATEESGEAGERTPPGPASSAGEMGAAGVPPGLRQLPVAFTRVLPRAAVGDQRFTKQKLGRVGEIRFKLVLDAGGRILRADYAAGASPLLQDLVERTLRFLGKGQFALAPEPSADNLAGEQGVVVRLSLSQGAASDGDPTATRSLGFEPPRGKQGASRTGRGYFELESGLRLDAEVEFE